MLMIFIEHHNLCITYFILTFFKIFLDETDDRFGLLILHGKKKTTKILTVLYKLCLKEVVVCLLFLGIRSSDVCQTISVFIYLFAGKLYY